MRTLHSEPSTESSGLTCEQLEARLNRERAARQQAETLLEEKSRELYTASTALKSVAEAVDSQRLQLDTILEHTLAGIILANGELEITRANRKAISMFKLGADYFAEMTIKDLFENYAELEEQVGLQLDAEQAVEDNLHETVGICQDGSKFPLEYGLASMELDGRKQSVWIFRDITKRKHAEAKRAALENELSQAQKMESLGTLASGVAHEINTPIQYIGDNLRFLKDTFADLTDLINLYETSLANIPIDDATTALLSKLAAKTEEIDLEFLSDEAPLSLDQSLEGVSQVARIVNAIKEFSHPGEDEKSELDLNQAIETTITVTKNQWKYVADIETDLAPDLPPLVCLPGDINQVILNLIVNAADAIGAGDTGKKGEIKVQSRLDGDAIEFSIADNGCGIPADILERIYDPFFTTKGVGKGTGQGLAITYAIVKKKHKGTIECQSEAGAGTKFIIRLPIAVQNPCEREVA